MKTAFIELLKNSLGKHVEGEASGFSKWLNGKIHRVSDEGDIELEFTVREDLCNPYGVMHGGAMSAILDEVMGLLLFIKSEENATYLALGIHAHFVKAAKMGETLIAIPHIVRIGRQVAAVHCELRSVQGHLVAQGSANFLRMT